MRRRLRGKPTRDPKTKKVVGYELPDLKTIELQTSVTCRLLRRILLLMERQNTS